MINTELINIICEPILDEAARNLVVEVLHRSIQKILNYAPMQLFGGLNSFRDQIKATNHCEESGADATNWEEEQIFLDSLLLLLLSSFIGIGGSRYLGEHHLVEESD